MNWEAASDNETVCYCRNISKKIIVEAIRNGNQSLKSIQNTTTACTGNSCKVMNPSGDCCFKDIMELIKIYGEPDNFGEFECDCNCNCNKE